MRLHNPFRPKFGPRYTKALFIEFAVDTDIAMYTLKDEDVTIGDRIYPSLRRLYLECGDITEYLFAVSYFEGVDHLQQLLGLTWFLEKISRWRRELSLQIKSNALRAIQAAANTTGKDSLAAAKFLLQNGWDYNHEKIVNGSSQGRGRPSKDEIKQAAKEQTETMARISEDFSRLFEPSNKIN